MRILLLSAYDAESHNYWRKGLVEHLPEHDWTVLSLPGRYFSWRMRGNSLSWAFGERALLERGYDLVIATSMTDLSALRGFVPSLAQTPTLVYFHENQFAYPSSGKEFKSVEPCILNLYTALAADHCVFNSEYNRRTLLQGTERLLKKLPDHVPANLVQRIAEHSSVLPVPLKDDSFSLKPIIDTSVTCSSSDRPIRIAWAARWEYDKGPDRLLAILNMLENRDVNYRLCILGQSFKNSPEEFQVIQAQFDHRIDHAGYAESREAYKTWLRSADIFLSTSIHEFQGIAVLEAVAQGCVPVLPDRMSYPEMFSSDYLYTDCGSNVETEANVAVDTICRQKLLIEQGRHQVPDVSGYSWEVMAERYREAIARFSDKA